MKKFQDRYRIESSRAAWWNYGWSGSYFITICTRNRERLFGQVYQGKMELSTCGLVAEACWRDIPLHGHHVELGAFVVMPDHIHGILVLNTPMDTPDPPIIDPDKIIKRSSVDTRHALYLRYPSQEKSNKPILHNSPDRNDKNPNTHFAQNRFRNPGKNTLSSLVGSYKSAVTKSIRRMGVDFGWQSRFYDRIIRNEAEYHRIHDYIENNPMNWKSESYI